MQVDLSEAERAKKGGWKPTRLPGLIRRFSQRTLGGFQGEADPQRNTASPMVGSALHPCSGGHWPEEAQGRKGLKTNAKLTSELSAVGLLLTAAPCC